MLRGEDGFCTFTYQGQDYDKDINLTYNRMRWYNQEEGIYCAQDPIGLAGGLTLYGYSHDTNSWVDIFGLARAPSTILSGNIKKGMGGKNFTGFQAHHVIPTDVWLNNETFLGEIGLGGKMNEAFNGIMLPSNPTTMKNSDFDLIHNTSHDIYSGKVGDRVGSISDDYYAGVIGKTEARTKIRKLQMEIKNKIANGDVDTTDSKKHTGCKRMA